ncbi:MAG: hotdog fold thioesterase, partial [Porticoccaceae bacterium]|nr:hotdog fold thioesterase [Porticoccaceae bacterium]
MSSIWHNRPKLEMINGEMNSGTVVEHLGIKITEVGDDYLTGTMPADARTFQPYGVVHGGANVV